VTRVIVDTDTAGDDTQALALAVLTERLSVEAVTVVAGNAPFDRQVENAKYTLELAGVADTVSVYEGARRPLVKDHDTAEEIQGEGGLGGRLFPETGIPSGERHAVDFIVDTARAHPGEVTVLAIAPLTNLALALQREPALDDLLDEVWVMGGAIHHPGNVTPTAEYNVWVDPDAAKRVLADLPVTLFDWGLSVRGARFGAETLAEIEAAASGSPYADFYTSVTRQVRAFNRETFEEDAATQPDSLVAACLIEPGLIQSTETYIVDVDAREGMTRGYTQADPRVGEDENSATQVVESVDAEGFRRLFLDAVIHGDPDRSLESGP